MRMYRKLLLKEFLPFLLLGVVFFSLILVLADIFANLWQYLNREIPFSQAIYVSLLYVPKAVSYSLPIGAMFAAAFSLGNLGSRNELIAVFGAGVPLFRFIIPILVAAVILSVGGFLFEDIIVIPFLKERNNLSKELLDIQDVKSRSQAAVIAEQGEVVYYSDYYNDETKTLAGLTVIIQEADGTFVKRIDAERAVWVEDVEIWEMEACRVFTEEQPGEVIQKTFNKYREERLVEPPETFRLDTRDLEEMTNTEAIQWIGSQKRAGLPYKAHQAKLYQRYTIAFTPILVILFAGALGGRFRRNVLLMSLLVSLALSSGWYIFRMIATLLSELGYISPLFGAAVPYALFLSFGFWLFRHAKT
ncbi:MAG: hypothetical protein B0D92_01615 [Spirochaeta sp. LUC14_002_19_P3]|nr:MAG: hypothetical protein B0D92_01615 [Spirochaeta sp. LUC14_002_19_P3]